MKSRDVTHRVTSCSRLATSVSFRSRERCIRFAQQCICRNSSNPILHNSRPFYSSMAIVTAVPLSLSDPSCDSTNGHPHHHAVNIPSSGENGSGGGGSGSGNGGGGGHHVGNRIPPAGPTSSTGAPTGLLDRRQRNARRKDIQKKLDKWERSPERCVGRKGRKNMLRERESC